MLEIDKSVRFIVVKIKENIEPEDIAKALIKDDSVEATYSAYFNQRSGHFIKVGPLHE